MVAVRFSMRYGLLVCVSAASIGFVFGESVFGESMAFSQTPIPVEPAMELPAPAANPPELPAPQGLPTADVVPTTQYSDATMSLDYPSTWQVEVDAGGMVSIQTAADAPQAVTQVFRVATPPGPLVDANIDSFVEEGAAVNRYSSVTIDDRDALVIWLSDRPDELSNAIATFIGYGDETVFLFSRFTANTAESEQPSLEDSLLRMHSSFSNVEAVEEAIEPSPVSE